MTRITIDILDKAIIEQIRNNPGIEIVDLSRHFGSLPAIEYKVDALERHGYITTVKGNETRTCYIERPSLTV